MKNETTDLINVEKINALELFTGEKLDPFLEKIEKEVMSIVPDTTTTKGRKEIASLAHKVSRSKVVFDGMGKDLVADWKAKAKKVDVVRKKAKDFLDNLRDKARQPLTDWEKAEEERVEAERLAEELETAHFDAIQENDLFDRQKAVAEKEAEFAKIEQERKDKEEAARLAKEQAARDEKLKKEAADKAKKEAEEKARLAKERAAKKLAEEKARAEKAEKDRLQTIENARVAKEKAAAKAKEDQEKAVKEAERKAKEEADRKEKDRLDQEMAQKVAREKRVENKKHREKVKTEALRFIKGIHGTTAEQAEGIFDAIATGEVPHITVNF